jgi:hypothetical protein
MFTISEQAASEMTGKSISRLVALGLNVCEEGLLCVRRNSNQSRNLRDEETAAAGGATDADWLRFVKTAFTPPSLHRSIAVTPVCRCAALTIDVRATYGW